VEVLDLDVHTKTTTKKLHFFQDDGQIRLKWLLFAIDIILSTTRKRDGILMSRDKVPGVDYPDVKTETRKVVGTTFLDLTQ